MLPPSDPSSARFAPLLLVFVGLGGAGCKDASSTEPVADVTEEISRADSANPPTETKAEDAKPKPTGEAKEVKEAKEDPKGLVALTKGVVDGAKKDKARDPLMLLSAKATMVFQARPAALYAIEGFADAVDYLGDKTPELKNAMSAMSTCGLDPKTIETVTIGVDADDDGALIVRGPSWGDIEKWRCMRTELKALGGSADFEIDKDGEESYLRSGSDQIRFPDDETLVLFDEKWERDTKEILAGTSTKKLSEMPIASVIDRVNVEEPVWGAVILRTSQLDGTPMAGITEIWGALAIGDELDLTIAGKTDSADRAKEMRDEVQKQWDEVKGMAAAFGIPSSLTAKIEFKAVDDVAKFHMRATPQELREAGEKIAGMM